MMIMTYEQILKVTEYQGVAINDKIRQKAIEMTEQLDLLSYHEGLEIVLDDMELLVNEQAEEMTKQAKKVQKEMTKAQSDKKPKKVDSLAKVKTQKGNGEEEGRGQEERKEETRQDFAVYRGNFCFAPDGSSALRCA